MTLKPDTRTLSPHMEALRKALTRAGYKNEPRPAMNDGAGAIYLDLGRDMIHPAQNGDPGYDWGHDYRYHADTIPQVLTMLAEGKYADGQMDRGAALSVGILALNTLAHPDATDETSFDWLDANTPGAVESLAALRDDLADPDPVAAHVEAVCKQAGLPVMVGVFGILRDRGEATDDTLLALGPEDVTGFYEGFVAPAIDRIGDDLADGQGD